MAEETKNDVEVTPAPAKKTRAPRKSASKATTPATGEAGDTAAPAATPAARKSKTPRTRREPKAAAPAEQAPAPAEQERQKAPRRQRTATESAPAETNAKPLNTSEERADSVSEERPLVRHLEQAQPKPVSVPGFATPETVGGGEGNGGNGRRKRRRNRNRNRGEGQQQQQGGNCPRVDADELYRRAWKIFLGEVTEEGLALMDDRTAQEASRRAFRVAELFLQEATRHRPSVSNPPAESAEEAESGEAEA